MDPKFAMIAAIFVAAGLAVMPGYAAFEVDTSEQPSTHPPISPEDGSTVSVNPPSMIWRVDDRAATYTLELARDRNFSRDVIEIEGIDMPFYNHDAELEEGMWYWRYYVIDEDGERSQPGPVRSFDVPADALSLPIPPTSRILENLPDHPRIFTTPDELDDFRARRHGPAREAWEQVQWRADRQLGRTVELPDGLEPLSESHRPTGETPRARWSEGDPTRRQAIFLVDGEPMWDEDFTYRNLGSMASRANTLSYAYLISGEEQYAEAARDWVLLAAKGRIDYHLDYEERVHHDTVVYCYEQGLKYMALTYDRIRDYLTEDEREEVLEHIAYHVEPVYDWLRDGVRIHLEYQRSHPQQAMHPLLVTLLAVAPELERGYEWSDYFIRQYANRIAWTSEDGGYFEGPTYAHKFRWILEALVALRTAADIDLFQKPRIKNSGPFWMYALSLNYWYEHGGDIYSLLWPWGNPADAYITNLLASMNQDPYVQWWSDTVYTNPVHVPFQYLSDTDLDPVPPIDIAQAKLFPDTGQLAAYDRFYDHLSDRIFFRSSQWGGHSHAHADQNNFVIHAGGEILAADTGYYTYYGDDYHMGWTVTTNTHNSILINGEGQPKGIDYKGDITEFLHSPLYTFFAGDASEAYEEPMERFERAILYVRPNVYIVYDELAAAEPSQFNWLLNTFHEAEIDEQNRLMTVPQQHMRMDVRHLLPADLDYEQSNERRYPIWTRDWSRVSEAFPEPWHIRVTNTEPRSDERFVTLIDTYDQQDGSSIVESEAIETDHALGVRFTTDDGIEETVLFARHMRDLGRARHGQVRGDGIVTAVGASDDGAVQRWAASHATRIAGAGATLFTAQQRIDAAAAFNLPGAAAQFWLDAPDRQRIVLNLPDEPGEVLVAPPYEPKQAEAIDHEWRDGQLILDWPGGDAAVVWVDPAFDIRQELPQLPLTLTDSTGEQELPLDIAVAENGQWVAYGELDVREKGEYRITSSNADAEVLIQDRWDPAVTQHGHGSATGALRDKTEVFIHFDPADGVPQVQAELERSYAGELVNYLRNGDFEQGIVDYPPRGWTIIRSSRSEERGWPEWTQEDAVSGDSAVRILRRGHNITLRSAPMRLTTEGTYILRFHARGDAPDARVSVDGERGTGGRIDVEPTDEWTLYELELEMAPGYTEVHIEVRGGDERDDILWVDDMAFGPIHEPYAE